MQKNFCSVHHLYYTSNECPCCIADRTNALASKFITPKNSAPKEEITEEALEALKDKFNTPSTCTIKKNC